MRLESRDVSALLMTLTLSAGGLSGCGERGTGTPLGTVGLALEVACAEEAEAVPEGAWLCGQSLTLVCEDGVVALPDEIHVLLPQGDEPAEAPACADAGFALEGPVALTPGEHDVRVSWQPPDGGEQLLCESHLTIVDTTPPEVTPLSLTLWPPNHAMHAISVADCVEVHDACDPDVRLDLLRVTSDEADEATGDGNTTGDIAELTCDGVSLRAERQGGGDGRVYTLHWRAQDSSGNATDGTCTVTVPHDQGKKGAAIDSGVSWSAETGGC